MPFRLALASTRLQLALFVALTLTNISLPIDAWARSHQFDSTALLTPEPTSFAQCPQFFANSKPPVIAPRPLLRELCYEAFAVLHSGTTRTPVFVAQRLNRESIEDADEKRAKRFFTDARLPSAERAELEDYKGSGYSRGHMAPAGDMPTPTAMVQSFSLANVVPQNAQHNGGAWAKIEQDTRHYVRRAKGDVFVITGPVFADDAPQIGANRVRVPAYLYKLVYDAATQRAWAYWQENREGETAGRPISYGELVKRTGVEFLPGISVQH
jgi:endonuclease G